MECWFYKRLFFWKLGWNLFTCEVPLILMESHCVLGTSQSQNVSCTERVAGHAALSVHRHLLDIEVWLAVFCLTVNWVLCGHDRKQRSQCLAGERTPGRLMWPVGICVVPWRMTQVLDAGKCTGTWTVPSKKSERSVSQGCLRRLWVLAADIVRLWTIFRWFPPPLAHLKSSLQG